MPRRLKQTREARHRRKLYAERMADAYLAELERRRQSRQADAVKADPERLAKRRASRRAYHERQKAKAKAEAREISPELAALRREQSRIRYVAAKERNGGQVAPAKRAPYAKGNRPRLEAKRAGRWIRAYAKLIDAGEGDRAAAKVAADLGLVARRVQALMYDQQTEVEFDVVDRAIANSGPAVVTMYVNGHKRAIHSVDDLYPQWWRK